MRFATQGSTKVVIGLTCRGEAIVWLAVSVTPFILFMCIIYVSQCRSHLKYH